MTLEDAALRFVLPVLALAMVLTFVRLVRGPRLADRVVALDLLTVMGIGIGAVYSIGVRQPVYLDVAIVLALVSFLATVAFAHYVGRRR